MPEIVRCRDLGHVGLLVPLYDDCDTDFGAREWDPVWRTAQDSGLPIGFHAFVRAPGERSSVTEGTMDALVERPARVQRALLSLILGHVFARFPRLRVVSAENEAGWAAPMLERADTAFRRGRFRDLPAVRSTAPRVRCSRTMCFSPFSTTAPRCTLVTSSAPRT